VRDWARNNCATAANLYEGGFGKAMKADVAVFHCGHLSRVQLAIQGAVEQPEIGLRRCVEVLAPFAGRARIFSWNETNTGRALADADPDGLELCSESQKVVFDRHHVDRQKGCECDRRDGGVPPKQDGAEAVEDSLIAVRCGASLVENLDNVERQGVEEALQRSTREAVDDACVFEPLDERLGDLHLACEAAHCQTEL